MSEDGSYFQRDRTWHPPAFTPDYKTSVLRSPRYPLLSLEGAAASMTNNAVVASLLILWLLGAFVFPVAGGLIHVLLVIALVVVLYRVITGRRLCRSRRFHSGAGEVLFLGNAGPAGIFSGGVRGTRYSPGR